MVKYSIIKEQELTTEDRLNAAAKLSGGGFKLYCYLESFPCGVFIYSRKDFIEKIGLTIKTANSAFEELIQNNYLFSYSNTLFRFGIFY